MQWLDLFAGCGGATTGLRSVVAAIEQQPHIARCYSANHPDVMMISADIRDISPRSLPSSIDAIWASPVCKQDSQARIGKTERREDADIGLGIIPYLECIQPALFVLENVSRYQHNPSFHAILETLIKQRYMIEVRIINMNQYGIPQYRERLILQARRGPLAWPEKRKPCSWYTSLSDLFPIMEEAGLANWQRQLWKSEYDGQSLLVAGHYKFRKNAKEEKQLYVLTQNQSSPCVTASYNCLQRRVVLAHGQELRISPRENARLQTFPDGYLFPDIAYQAQEMIGNAVPPLFVQYLVDAYSLSNQELFHTMPEM